VYFLGLYRWFWLSVSMRILSITVLLLVAMAPDCARPVAAQSLPAAPQGGAAHLSLPACVNSEGAIADVKRSIASNAASARKYDGYRQLLQSDTAVVLAARLAYAETLAANCPLHNEDVLELVAAVIANRVRIRRGDVNSVVFQRNQFASSLHIYSESRYRDFLCPRDEKLWQKAVARMQANLEGAAPNAPVPKDAVNYYLYQHSARFSAPDWGLQEARISNDDVRKCIRIFRSPAWR
jgi:hypothetical protein